MVGMELLPQDQHEIVEVIPLDPLVPLDPEVPELPLVPDVPLDPEVPDVPLVPVVPDVTSEPPMFQFDPLLSTVIDPYCNNVFVELPSIV